jgi:hypothetical protein
MKKLFYRLSSSQSLARLLFILAFVALQFLFVQQAAADDLLGWDTSCEPDCVATGVLDATLRCGAVVGATTLTRVPPSGDTVQEAGQVECHFEDTGTNPVFKESAICTLNIGFSPLEESCEQLTNTLTITGTCPYQASKNSPIVGTQGGGTIDCHGGGLDSNENPTGKDPKFCLYEGTDPTGNTSGKCIFTLGFGAQQGSKIVPLTQAQCQTAFPSDLDLQLNAGDIFKVELKYSGPVCTGQFRGVETLRQRSCTNDGFDGSAAFCDFQQGTVKNTAEGQQVSHLTADNEYSPNRINADCANNKDQGDITLLVRGNNIDPGTNPVDVHAIDQDTITVNGRPINKSPTSPSTDSCSFPDPNTLSCRVPSCLNSQSIIVPGTDTLQMDAFMNDRTHVVGDIEHKKTSGK